MRHKTVLILVILALLMFPTASFAQPVGPIYDPTMALLRIHHLAGEIAPVKLLVNGETAIEEIPTGNRDKFLQLAPQSYDLAFVTIADEEDIFAVSAIELVAGGIYEMVIRGNPSDDTFEGWILELQASEFTDDLIEGVNAHLSIHHRVEGLPIDLYLADGATYIEGLEHGQVGIVDVLAGEYDMLITRHGEAQNVLFDLTGVTLLAGTVYVIALVGDEAAIEAESQPLFTDSICVSAAC